MNRLAFLRAAAALAAGLALSAPALAAPQARDPANIDAGGGGDPAYVFSHQPAQRGRGGSGMPLVDRIASSGRQSLGETWDRITGPGADDYQQAYGNANIRDRFARGYGYANDGSTLSIGGSGNWLGQMLQGGRSPALAPPACPS